VEVTAVEFMVGGTLLSFSSLAMVPVKILFPFPRPALLRMARCTITLSPASTVFRSTHHPEIKHWLIHNENSNNLFNIEVTAKISHSNQYRKNKSKKNNNNNNNLKGS